MRTMTEYRSRAIQFIQMDCFSSPSRLWPFDKVRALFCIVLQASQMKISKTTSHFRLQLKAGIKCKSVMCSYPMELFKSYHY